MTSEHRSLIIDGCRLRAVLALRGVGIEAFARVLLRPVSYRYLASICSGGRVPSVELLEALQGALGPDAWAFVTGACDTLTAPRIQGRERLAKPLNGSLPAGGCEEH